MRQSWIGIALGLALAQMAAHTTLDAQSTPPASSSRASVGSAPAFTPARLPDGQPDIQGTWLNFDSTPFEAPVDRPAASGGSQAAANVGPASEFADHSHQVSKARRSMVVDPPDGRVPLLPSAEARRDYDLAHVGDSYLHETPWVRCVTRGFPAGMFPAGYNNAYQIIQVPGYVVIASEMIHETRIIPVDGRPALGSAIRQWNGESHGRWEGNTLVVLTTNFNDKGDIATSAATGRIRGVAQSDALKVTERFTPVDAKTIAYEVRIEDPKIYSRPWTVQLPLNRDDTYQMFEYACHEGNLSIPNELTAGRAADAAAAGSSK